MLRESTGAGDPDCTWQSQPGNPTITGSCHNMTMDAFALRIRGMANDYLPSLVLNQTGLDGAYDFELRWNQRSRVLPPGVERTTIFGAVEKQLGLVLEPTAAPAQVMVIDRVVKFLRPTLPTSLAGCRRAPTNSK